MTINGATPVALSDTQVDKSTFDAVTYLLGPKTVGTQTNLYKVRNVANYYWYNPDLIGIWKTAEDEDDTGTYVLRLEVFDENGNKLDVPNVDYRDGTVTPPAEAPPMTSPPKTSVPPAARVNRCDLVITLDNNQAVVALSPQPVPDPSCGVVSWNNSSLLAFNISVSQPHNRLGAWSLTYIKGVSGGSGTLAHSPAAPTPIGPTPNVSNQLVPGSPLTNNLNTTCAFAITLSAWAHIRDGRSFWDGVHLTQAIAIEGPNCTD